MALDKLNPEQRAAATCGEGASLVIAGAGTGKTQTLVHRVAWLIEQGVPAETIVLLTFTRRSAQEMLERAAQMVGPAARRVRGGTFHAFANTQLRVHGHRLGYTPKFGVLDQDDAGRLIAAVRQQMGLAGKERGFLRADALNSLWSLHRNTSRPLDEIVDEQRPEHIHEVEQIETMMRACDLRRKKLNVMDYDDLLVRFAELLWSHDEARQRIAGAARHVLVDEYQDTNRLQAKIATGLSSEHGNLLVVGDEAQSIYAFRGASVRNILDYPKMFDTCRQIVLEENYRSTSRILDLANGVLESAAEGFEKRLRSGLGQGAWPDVINTDDEDQQAAEVMDRILAFQADGVALRDIAVLVRSGFHSNLLEVELARRRMAFRKFGGLKFVEASHVKDVLCLFRIVANPMDELAWTRLLGCIDGLGEASAAKIAADVAGSPHLRLEPERYKGKKWAAIVSNLATTLLAAETDATDARAKRLVDWYRPIAERLYDDAKKRAKDLDTVEQLAARAEDLDAFLADLSLDPPLSDDAGGQEQPDEDDHLVISTIHSAKGLEWKVVFVLSLADGAFPSGYALDDPDDIEEERRLLYVAVTRARERLFLGCPQFVRSRGKPVAEGRCTLIEDIPGFDALTRRAEPLRRQVASFGRGRMDRFRDYFGD